jgi:hypothetical protein
MVPGGYPEAWAMATGAPYPPLSTPQAHTRSLPSDSQKTPLVPISNSANNVSGTQDVHVHQVRGKTTSQSECLPHFESRKDKRVATKQFEPQEVLGTAAAGVRRSARNAKVPPALESSPLGDANRAPAHEVVAVSATAAAGSSALHNLRSSTNGLAPKGPASLRASQEPKTAESSQPVLQPNTSVQTLTSQPPVAPQPHSACKKVFQAAKIGHKRTRSASQVVSGTKDMLPAIPVLHFPSTVDKHDKLQQCVQLRPQFGHVRKARRIVE